MVASRSVLASLVVGALTLSSGCVTAGSLVPRLPWAEPDAAHPGVLDRVPLYVEPLTPTPESELGVEALGGLRAALGVYLRNAGSWSQVLDSEEALAAFRAEHPGRRVVRLRTRVTHRYYTRRTYVLDLLSIMTIGYFPLSPSWGEAEVELEAQLIGPAGDVLVAPARARIAASHGTAVWSLVRSDELEEAFRRVHERAFGDVARDLSDRMEGRVKAVRERKARAAAARVATASTAVGSSTAALAQGSPPLDRSIVDGGGAVDVMTGASASTTAVAALDTGLEDDDDGARGTWRLEATQSTLTAAYDYTGPVGGPLGPGAVFLPPDGFDILTRPLGGGSDGILSRYLSALGGLEAAAFRGGATVQSRTRTSNSESELVGAGQADARGYRFSFYRPPDRTGFFFPPSIGLLWEDITIEGFRDTIPRAQSDDIPALASDPVTGLGIDANEPLSYDLQLRSAFVGQGLGLNVVAGTEDVQIFFTFQGHVNLLEVRYVDVTIGRTRVDGFSVTAAQSVGLGGQLGLVFPGAHLAVRGMFSYDWFFDFDFPEPVEFPAATRYNAEKDVFERERAFVDGASLRTYNAQIAVSVLF